MKRLIGRKVCLVSDTRDYGVVYVDTPEAVWVRFKSGKSKFIAKFRLLTNEVLNSSIPARPDVYLIAK